MKIVIETIPHEQQRYPTCGDYWLDPDGTLQIRVSKLPSPDQEHLIAVHELVEAILVGAAGIPFSAVDRFDKLFEAERESGKHGTAEPGDDPRAPYRNAHCVATGIERLVAGCLRVD